MPQVIPERHLKLYPSKEDWDKEILEMGYSRQGPLQLDWRPGVSAYENIGGTRHHHWVTTLPDSLSNRLTAHSYYSIGWGPLHGLKAVAVIQDNNVIGLGGSASCPPGGTTSHWPLVISLGNHLIIITEERDTGYRDWDTRCTMQFHHYIRADMLR